MFDAIFAENDGMCNYGRYKVKEEIQEVLEDEFFDVKAFEEIYKLKYLPEDFVDATRLACLIFVADLIEAEDLAEARFE